MNFRLQYRAMVQAGVCLVSHRASLLIPGLIYVRPVVYKVAL